MAIEINRLETSGINQEHFLVEKPELSCFIPICPYSFMANRSFLEVYLPQTLSRCKQALIVVGDYLERYNIMVFNGISEEEALIKEDKRGRKILQTIESMRHLFPPDCEVTIQSCRTYIESPEGKEIASSLQKYYNTNDEFQSDIKLQTQLMLQKTNRCTQKNVQITDEAKTLLYQYMIEELTLYLSVYQLGFTTEIYPGRDINILRSMAEGAYNNFPFNYSERTHISISVLLDTGVTYARLDNAPEEGN